VLTRGEEALREEGLSPGEKGRVIDLAKSARMDHEVQHLPQRNLPGAARVLPLAKGKEGVRRRQDDAGTG
jgi:hypothetical protein